ncbi:(2Fe-2S)-binding protein [Cupriavidus plantarum]|uniref:(2Fe-2S)-binding protein n=1 Tax=Cupriavidus plantarum TaxID=942865 RepID=UPI000E281358|nr:(2Fe-2S)-binding protein [Cupriavidus plantarum]REE89232.1 2-furoyl-CoA dehydrogenase 2Fe-2S iron sulfur subunit [Cupriavidus plantarum]RLK31748.1 2-furoyl-CoA dehydrogenase 2Fe-2S iron sulfur subunit [Cupriavidus plantarum]
MSKTIQGAASGKPVEVMQRNAQRRITLTLNGRKRSGHCEPRELLSDFLRHELGATGTHVGCEHGVCGACTVRVDGVAARSCLMLAVQAEDRDIDTVEGLAPAGELGDLQEAFRRHHALQCGFCTAGILMSCADYLARVPEPNEAQVRDMLSGHLCRCTGYTPIVAAVLDVAASRAASDTRAREDAIGGATRQEARDA